MYEYDTYTYVCIYVVWKGDIMETCLNIHADKCLYYGMCINYVNMLVSGDVYKL